MEEAEAAEAEQTGETGRPGTRAARRGAQGGGRRAGSLTGLVVVCQAAGLGCKVQGALQPLFLQQQR